MVCSLYMPFAVVWTVTVVLLVLARSNDWMLWHGGGEYDRAKFPLVAIAVVGFVVLALEIAGVHPCP